MSDYDMLLCIYDYYEFNNGVALRIGIVQRTRQQSTHMLNF